MLAGFVQTEQINVAVCPNFCIPDPRCSVARRSPRSRGAAIMIQGMAWPCSLGWLRVVGCPALQPAVRRGAVRDLTRHPRKYDPYTARMTSPRLTLRERQKIQTRDQLLSCAGELFAEKGFGSTSIDDITQCAGTSRATLYAYFDGKDALLAAIVDQMWVDGHRFYAEFGELADWSRASVLTWVNRFALAWRQDAARNKAASIAAPGVFMEAAKRHRQMAEALRSNAALWTHFTQTEARLRSLMVVNLVESQLADFYFLGSDTDLDVFTGYLADAVRSLLDVR